MALPKWPAGLPPAIFPGAQRAGLFEGKETSEFDSGPPQERARFSTIPETLVCVLKLERDDQVQELLGFHDTTLAMGALPFEWELPEDPGVAVKFRFKERPTFEYFDVPQYWKASVSLYQVL